MFDINITQNTQENIYDIAQLFANVVTICSIIYKLIPFKYLNTTFSKMVSVSALNRNPCPVVQAEKIKAKEIKKCRKDGQ